MGAPFPSAQAKLDRACEQLTELEVALQDTLSGHLFRFEAVPNPDAYRPPLDDAYSVLIRYEPLSLRWAVIVGEILHDLRSALDHAFNVLAVGPGVARDDGDIQFPLYRVEDDYNSWRTGKRRKRDPMTNVPAPAICVIEAIQPFQAKKRGEDPSLQTLSVFSSYSNGDKHRLITPTVPGAEAGGWGGFLIRTDPSVEIIDVNFHWPINEPLDNGASVAALRVSEVLPDLKVEVSGGLPFAVFVDSQRQLVATLQEFKEAVIEVVSRLEPHVPQ